MNNHPVSSARLVHASASTPVLQPAPVPTTPPAHATLRALFVDRAFVGALRRLASDEMDADDIGELLDNTRQLALAA